MKSTDHSGTGGAKRNRFLSTLIDEWISASNAYDLEKYLGFYSPGAILDDPSVGKSFKSHIGITEYFEKYFLGYKTQTKLTKLVIYDDANAYVEVMFSGTFPGGKVGGSFYVRFKGSKIAHIKADLIESRSI